MCALFDKKTVLQLQLNYQLTIEVSVDNPGLSNKAHNRLP